MDALHVPRDVSDMLSALLHGIQSVLGGNLVGVYLRGSLALGDFDPTTSDLDFLAVTERIVSEVEFVALKASHKQIGEMPNKYASDIEGTYIPLAEIRRFKPGGRYPTIGRGGDLEWSAHGNNWALERWAVREHGIILAGPNPQDIIDPVPPDELRTAVRMRLKDWEEWASDPNDPDWLSPLQHMAYVVETMCRALCTIATGEVLSKPRAVAWALENVPEQWRETVAMSRAWRTDNRVDQSVIPVVRNFVLWATAQRGAAGAASL